MVKEFGLNYMKTQVHEFSFVGFFTEKQLFLTQFRPKQDYPERACATVTFQGQNLAEALISRGLAVRIRHRQDDDNRSSQYDELVAAEQRAQKAEKGCYAKSLPAKIQIQELDTKTAKATFPLLKGKRLDATVDYVFSGSRLKV